MQKIIPTLWFNLNGEEAVNFYISLFEDGEILEVMRFPAGAPYNEEGTVATIRFQIFGQEYIALNGGPKFPFTNAVSFTVYCKDQAEIDRLWNAIEKAGGTPQQCGWITDQFGLPWQICPREMIDMFQDKNRAKSNAAFGAMVEMVKIDIAAVRKAFENA